MIKFITIRSNSDDTYDYDVILDKDYTLEDFLNYILTRNEWGTISIGNVLGRKIIYYKRDDVIHVDDDFVYSNDLFHKQISSVTANGGWGLMHYGVIFKED